MDDATIANASGRLRQCMAETKKSEIWKQIVEPRDAVLARFRPIFDPAYIPKLTEVELRPFFYFENNHHWTGLYRQVNRVCADMTRLKNALLIMTDESRPIAERLDDVGGAVPGMGKAIITAILTVAFPSKYGVWNSTSEAGLLELGLWPEFERGASFGTRYDRINSVLSKLTRALNTDFWTLDALWWQLSRADEVNENPARGAEVDDNSPPCTLLPGARFGLERHLQDFLYDNWAQTDLGAEWEIFSLPSEPEAGYEYTCPVGRIDILAKHRTAKKWLVIELKRNNSSDTVVGQVLRYMGWVGSNLAESGEEVRGLIIARSGDPSLQYAVSAVPSLDFMTYEIEFRLQRFDAGTLRKAR